ncbi:MAG: glycosyltransferase family 4 protein [Candidatus Stahlbacteria bacterium]|nr:glycosyltransferase family 4 protein [Candidatus Stahlbacteria bacterium]
MKICVLGDASSVHIKRWVEYFVSKNWDVHLFSLEKSIGTSAIEHIFHSRVNIRWLKYPVSSIKIKQEIEQIDPDIINSHFVPNYGLIGALVNKHPLIISCWGSDILTPPHKTFLHNIRIRFVLGMADLITTDAQMLTDAVGGFGITRDMILTVPMGLDNTIFNPANRPVPTQNVSGEPTCSDAPVPTQNVSGECVGNTANLTIVHLRALEPIYNPELFVMACALIKQEKVKIVMSSAGSLKDKISMLANKLGVNIEFIPRLPQNEFANILMAATIYVSGSLSDSTSVTLLEAMACGAFPIVSDIPGNREWIIDGENGYLVPIDNPKYLADKIVKALRNPKLLKDARLRNDEIIHQHCLWEKNMMAIEAAFKSIINNR